MPEGVVRNDKGTPVTQAPLLSAQINLTAPLITQMGLLTAYRPPPALAVRVTQAPLMATYRPPPATGIRVTQAPTLAAVNSQGNLEVRVTQAALLMAWKTGVPGQTRQRAWTFDFDGHTFYVIDLAAEGTWVYDFTTEQWAKFSTPGFGVWNFLNGYAWESNQMVVGGHSLENTVSVINPNSFYDDGWRPIEYKVTGGISTKSRDGITVDSLRLSVSSGRVADTKMSPTISLRFSDDDGATYSNPYTYKLIAGSYNQRVEWNSLGSFEIPGRVFEFSDQGGLIRINGADIQIRGQ